MVFVGGRLDAATPTAPPLAEIHTPSTPFAPTESFIPDGSRILRLNPSAKPFVIRAARPSCVGGARVSRRESFVPSGNSGFGQMAATQR